MNICNKNENKVDRTRYIHISDIKNYFVSAEMIKIILTIIFLLNSYIAFANKDRIERPKAYCFVFQNHDTVQLDNSANSILNAYNDDIVNGKRKLVKAILSFKTGETITFCNDGNKWTNIKISDGKMEICIPDTTIEKISEIHFATVALLWEGSDKQAFSAGYFYIRFEIGTEKKFNQYPELNLIFRENKFSNSTIWRQISKRMKQSIDF